MNPRRIEMIRRRPELAMLEEIVELCDMASRTLPMRDALSKIDQETSGLIPPHGASRGGSIERIHAVARQGLEAGRPAITDADMADFKPGGPS